MSEWVLWGTTPAYAGGEGIKITGGSLRHCLAERRARESDGGWSGLTILRPGAAYTTVVEQQGEG